MTTVGGNNVAYGSGQYYEAQIVYTTSYPSSTTYEVEWELRVYYTGALYDSTNQAGVPSGGDLKSSTSYGSKSYSDSSGGYKTYASGTKTGTRLVGSSRILEQSFWVEDLAEGSGGGGRSTVEATITIAAQPISAPAAAGASSISAITSTGFTQSWADPSTWNGDDDGDFDVAIDDASDFVGATVISVLDANSYAHTGKTGNTIYWVKARAKNSAGAGSYGAAVSVLTKPGVATALTSGALTQASAALGATAPAGGAASYQLQVATDAGFVDIVHDSSGASLSRSVTGLKPNTQHWFRWLAVNASGDSGWTAAATFTTLKQWYYDNGAALLPCVAYYDNGVAWVVIDAHFDGGGTWLQ